MLPQLELMLQCSFSLKDRDEPTPYWSAQYVVTWQKLRITSACLPAQEAGGLRKGFLTCTCI